MDKKEEQVVEVTEEVEKKKIDIKKLILWVVFVIVSLVGVFFLSTYIRWNAEISDKYEVIYTGQEEVQIKELKDFLGFDVDTNINSKQAIKAYCSSKFGDVCVTANYTSTIENALRNPRYVVTVVILIDLVLLYIIFKDRLTKKFRTYIYAALIGLFALYTVGYEVFKLADYYFFVNNNQNAVDAVVSREIIPNNGNGFRPLITYTINDKEYVTDLDITKKEVGKKFTIYYKGKNYEKIETRRAMIKHTIPIFIGICIMIVGVMYLRLNTKKIVEEEKEEGAESK